MENYLKVLDFLFKLERKFWILDLATAFTEAARMWRTNIPEKTDIEGSSTFPQHLASPVSVKHLMTLKLCRAEYGKLNRNNWNTEWNFWQSHGTWEAEVGFESIPKWKGTLVNTQAFPWDLWRVHQPFQSLKLHFKATHLIAL